MATLEERLGERRRHQYEDDGRGEGDDRSGEPGAALRDPLHHRVGGKRDAEREARDEVAENRERPDESVAGLRWGRALMMPDRPGTVVQVIKEGLGDLHAFPTRPRTLCQPAIAGEPRTGLRENGRGELHPRGPREEQTRTRAD